MKKKFARDFIDFSYNSSSVYQVIDLTSEILEENGFIELDLKNIWKLDLNSKYYLKKSDSAFIAFTTAKNINQKSFFKIVGSHTDSPGFRIKPNPEMDSNSYLRLNTEVYGGPILNTWFDRPLSLGGRILVKGELFKPKSINFKINRPILTIPNLAIHQNRTVNDGIKIDKQNDTLPIVKIIEEEINKNNLLDIILNDELIKKENISFDDILDFDIYLYDYDKGCILGANEEFISSGKIDNLASVYSGIHALINSKNNENMINVLVGFDNEEIGSSTKQGADSNFLLNVLERIYLSFSKSRFEFLSALEKSFMISADGAHSVHPAHPEKTDPVVKPMINKGIVVKISANQKYTSDGYSIAILKQILNKRVNLQYFVNNSRERGGSTIGPISSTHMEINSIDLGLAMLAMHSVRELCGVDDLFELKELLEIFYNEEG